MNNNLQIKQRSQIYLMKLIMLIGNLWRCHKLQIYI